MAQDAAHIFLRDAVVNSPGRLQALCRLKLCHVPVARDLFKGPSCNLGVDRTPGDRDPDSWIDLSQVERAGPCSIGVAIPAYWLRRSRRVERLQHLAASSP